MTITHHIHPDLLMEYARGDVDYATSLVVASHVSLCDHCRSELEMFDILASSALFLDSEDSAVNSTLEDRIFSELDKRETQTRPASIGPYPQPLVEALGHKEPQWKPLGAGVKQHIIAKDKHSSVRLLYIDGGRPVPEHSHGGKELTLVLQGAFHDQTGMFRIGDVETADETLEHQPIALDGPACICLAATSERLVFKSLLPRLLQPIFQI